MHSTRKRYTWITWLPLIGMVISAFVITAPLAYWIRMWGLAFALYFGFKWAVLYEWSGESGRISRYDWIRFFFFWPGMEIEEFLGAKGKAIHAKPGEWIAAILKTILGGILVWLVTPELEDSHARAWTGMIGLILMLHFGSFHLLSHLASFWKKGGSHHEVPSPKQKPERILE